MRLLCSSRSKKGAGPAGTCGIQRERLPGGKVSDSGEPPGWTNRMIDQDDSEINLLRVLMGSVFAAEPFVNA